MKLYATIISERAQKSQGGKHIETTIQNEERDILLRMVTVSSDERSVSRGLKLPNATRIIDGNDAFLRNLKSNIALYLDTKGERQKGDYHKCRKHEERTRECKFYDFKSDPCSEV